MPGDDSVASQAVPRLTFRPMVLFSSEAFSSCCTEILIFMEVDKVSITSFSLYETLSRFLVAATTLPES